MRANLQIVVTGVNDPTKVQTAAANNSRNIVSNLLRVVRSIVSGELAQRSATAPTVRFSTAVAKVPVTFASVVANDTVTINGIVLTATQHRATGTLTLASVAVGDTATINGVVFTAVSSLSPSINQFSQGGTNTQDAASLASQINADISLAGVVLATSATAVVTINAVTAGTGGNAITLAVSNSATIARSNSVLTNGAAIADNQFDCTSSNALNASSLATAVAASSSTLVSGHVCGSNRSATVTCATAVDRDYVIVDGTKLLAVSFSTLTGSAQIATVPPDVFEIVTSDSNAGSALAACINSHPVLADKFFAINTSGAVNIIEKNPTQAAAPIVTSSSGTTLAVTNVDSASQMKIGSICLLQAIYPGEAGNAVTIASSDANTLAINSQSRLTGGTSTTATF